MGIIFALIAMFGFGLSSGFAKHTNDISSVKNVFLREMIVSILLFVAVLLNIRSQTFQLSYILIAFGISILGYIALISFYKGLQKGKAGVIVPIANSSVIYTVILSTIFYSEKLSPVQVVALLILIIGIILSSINFKDFKNSSIFNKNSGIIFAMITSIGWGLIFTLNKIPISAIGPILTSFVIDFGTFLFCATHMGIQKEKLNGLSSKQWIFILLTAVTATIGALCFNIALSITNANIVAPIVFANPLITAIYGRLVFKEKLTLLQYLSAGMIVLGIVFISI